MKKRMLQVKNLYISYNSHMGEIKAVRGIAYDLFKGEILGIVGESGCGKSTAIMPIVGMLSENAVIKKNSEIIFNDRNLVNFTEDAMQSVRGKDISILFKDSKTSLNPTLTVGEQLIEHVIKRKKMDRLEAIDEALETLELIGINNPEEIIQQYPNSFSSGVRQKLMIAISLMCDPKIIVADEITKSLDVTIQMQILQLVKEIKEGLGTSIILTTSNLGIVTNLCDRINIMCGGLIVEKGTDEDIFYRSRHPYTWGLIKSIPNHNILRRPVTIEGQPPDLLNPPIGCPFVARCKYAMRICRRALPPLFRLGERHESACFLNHPEAPNIRAPINKRRVK